MTILQLELQLENLLILMISGRKKRHSWPLPGEPPIKKIRIFTFKIFNLFSINHDDLILIMQLLF